MCLFLTATLILLSIFGWQSVDGVFGLYDERFQRLVKRPKLLLLFKFDEEPRSSSILRILSKDDVHDMLLIHRIIDAAKKDKYAVVYR